MSPGWQAGHIYSHKDGLTPPSRSLLEQIRAVVAAHGHLRVNVGKLADDDLYQAGLTSHSSATLMLAIEDAFDVEFPERLLVRETFESIAAICQVIEQLRPAA